MRDLKTSLSASDEVIVAGKVSSSQDGIVVRGGDSPCHTNIGLLDFQQQRMVWLQRFQLLTE